MATGYNTPGPGVVQMIQMQLDEGSATNVANQIADALKKGTDDKKPKENLSAIDKAMGSLKDTAKDLAIALGLAWGVNKVIDFGKESIKAALDSRAVWASLGNAVRNVGVDYNAVSADIQKNAMQFLRAGIMGDEEFGTVLQTFVAISGNYEKSLKNVGVVADLAAARHMNLEEAANLVGKAMDGNVGMLMRLGIEVPKGADAVQLLADKFKGAAAAQDPLIKQQKALSETWDNLKEAIGEALLGVGKAGSVMTRLVPMIEDATKAIEENKDALSGISTAAAYAAKYALAGLLFVFSGLAESMALAAKAAWLWYAAKAAINVDEDTRKRAQEQADSISAWTDGVTKAAEAADKLGRSLLGLKGADKEMSDALNKVPPIPDIMKGPGGNRSVTGAKGTGADPKVKTAEEDYNDAVRAEQKHIQIAKEAASMDETRAEGIQRLIELQAQLQDDLDEGDLTWEQRIEVMKDMADVHDALQDALMKTAAQYGITEDVIKDAEAGNVKAVALGIAREAGIRAAWNTAKGVEMLARSIGFMGLGNPVSAAASHASAIEHFTSAALWGSLAGGAAGLASIGGGGGGGGGGGDAGNATGNIGGDAAQQAKTPGTIVNVYVDGFDPKSPKQQDYLAQANADIKQRYGDDSQVTIYAGADR